MMLPAKVNRSTMAAQRRGSVMVLVQPRKLSLEAIATELVSSLSAPGTAVRHRGGPTPCVGSETGRRAPLPVSVFPSPPAEPDVPVGGRPALHVIGGLR